MTATTPIAQSERPDDWITGVVLHMDPEQGDCWMDVYPEHLRAEVDEALKAASVYGFYPCELYDENVEVELTEEGAVRYWLYQVDLGQG